MPSINEVGYRTPSQPRQVRLDTTTRCNARCLSCHRHLSKRKGEMPTELIDQILNDISGWSTPLGEIVPGNFGELFLREDWAWILKMIASRLPQTPITLATNGTLLDEDGVKLLCEIPTIKVINFSINAYFDETYSTFTGLNPANIPLIRTKMATIKALRSDIILWASMVFDPINQTLIERDNFVAYWGDIAWPKVNLVVSAGRGEVTPVKLPCRSLFSDIVIGYDGKLSSCCFDPSFSLGLGYYSGDLLKDWQNPKLKKLRRIHNEYKREEINLCKQCTFS